MSKFLKFLYNNWNCKPNVEKKKFFFYFLNQYLVVFFVFLIYYFYYRISTIITSFRDKLVENIKRIEKGVTPEKLTTYLKIVRILAIILTLIPFLVYVGVFYLLLL